MSTNENLILTSAHQIISTDPGQLGKITGESFRSCIVVDGIAHYSASFLGDEQAQNDHVKRMERTIRDGKVRTVTK